MPKSLNKYYPGDRLFDCDVCGFTYHISEMHKGVAEGQKGLVVCNADFDNPHPRDTPPDLRPARPLREAN